MPESIFDENLKRIIIQTIDGTVQQILARLPEKLNASAGSIDQEALKRFIEDYITANYQGVLIRKPEKAGSDADEEFTQEQIDELLEITGGAPIAEPQLPEDVVELLEALPDVHGSTVITPPAAPTDLVDRLAEVAPPASDPVAPTPAVPISAPAHHYSEQISLPYILTPENISAALNHDYKFILIGISPRLEGWISIDDRVAPARINSLDDFNRLASLPDALNKVLLASSLELAKDVYNRNKEKSVFLLEYS